MKQPKPKYYTTEKHYFDQELSIMYCSLSCKQDQTDKNLQKGGNAWIDAAHNECLKVLSLQKQVDAYNKLVRGLLMLRPNRKIRIEINTFLLDLLND